MTEDFTHHPVLLEEVLAGLNIKPSGKYVDATFGRGGHAREILARLEENGRLLVMDRDPEAVAVARRLFLNDTRVEIVQGSFDMMQQVVTERQWLGKVDGILLDLGVSSPQLDNPQRGFSFRLDGALDMRMNPDEGISAAVWLSGVSEAELARVLKEYGEERYAKRIARAIVHARAEQPITSTRQLATIIAQANPSWEKGKDPATRSFQAIRIFINDELSLLQRCLTQAVKVLVKGGRLAVISFHSLEDRIVKRFFREQSKGDPYPSDLPVMQHQLNPCLRIIGKAIYPGQREVDQNPRARSAVLRVVEKVSA